MSNTHVSGEFNGFSGHVARTGHNELNVVHNTKNLFGGGEEVLRALLHSNTAQEEDDFFTLGDGDAVVAERMMTV